MVTIAIVILNWNGRAHLEEFLPSVLAADIPSGMQVDIYVADNGSTDDSIEFLKRNHPRIKLLTLNHNYGFAGGYNQALRQVSSDYYVLLNSDVEVGSGWLQPVIDLMENDKSIGVCQPKIRMYADKPLFEYAGAGGGWIDHLGYPFAKGRVFDTLETDHGQYDQTEPIFWASGAAMFIRANIYHEVGGLDNFFFAHMEEIDLCWRVQLAGYRVFVCTGSIVYHLGGGTLPKGNARKVYLNFRNNLIMLSKNLPWGQLLWKIPYRIFLDTISAWKSLFEGNGIYFWAVAKAHVGYCKWLLVSRRHSVFPVKRGEGRDGWYPRSIILKYFVQHKKTFAEIVLGKR